MSVPPVEAPSRRHRRTITLLVVGGLWFVSAPVAQWLLDLSPEGTLAYRLSAVVLFVIAIVLEVRDRPARR